MAYKSQMNEADALPKEDFGISVDKEYVKLQHNGMLLDPEIALDFAKVLSQHIWVLYVNNTNTPFYTSDKDIFIDRKYLAFNDQECVDYFNRAQIVHSQRCIFSISNNFDLAEKICRENPDVQEFNPRIEVG